MAKGNKRQENLDGIHRDRAIKNIGSRQVMTKKAVHVMLANGTILCGSKAPMFEIEGVISAGLPECGRCAGKLSAMIEENMSEILRNLWTEKRDDYGQPPLSKPLPKQRKVKLSEFQQPMLPDELLPIGSGKPIKETVTNG